MADEIVIVGAGAHARVVYDILLARGQAGEVTAFVDVEAKGAVGESIFEKPVLRGLAAFGDYVEGRNVTAILGHGNNSRRKALMVWLDEHGVPATTAVHPSAVISAGVEIGSGTTISAGTVVLTGASLGRGVIINTAATVDHDCVVEDFAQLAPGSHIAGRVRVAAEAFIGIGAAVIQNITIGGGCIVGAGAAVVRDTPEKTLVIGVPARVRKHL
ncbi:MAG: acetyltransferase [Planctomycetes bacterium]|nr:acetyltransferase [Planctomycetota bacterium]